MQSIVTFGKKLWDTIEYHKARSRDWFVVRAHGTHAQAWLIALSFSDASFFIIPPEVLFLPILLVDGTRWVYYSSIVVASSVLGAVFGFFIGAFLFDVIGEFIVTTYGLELEMQHISELYAENAFWAVFIGAFTPIPYKIFTLSAGFFGVNFLVFIVASIIGRGLRYFALGFLIQQYGKTLGALIYKYFNGALLATILLGAFYILLKGIF